ncbi:hypothetical protein EVAR_43252_1 [Eumeta japonica]|uniref:Uncharacterized protein n=1 Tax=Eumeta variegata TaxID=151549 RepID=A0A4C1WVT6_EUMVA|nr:hypothetical protein EVAR_43252_1 [Eumeta japonica]
MVERWHRSLKTALGPASTINHGLRSSIILLGLRAVPRSDTNVSAAELTFGKTLRLPGDFYDTDRNVKTSLRTERNGRYRRDVTTKVHFTPPEFPSPTSCHETPKISRSGRIIRQPGWCSGCTTYTGDASAIARWAQAAHGTFPERGPGTNSLPYMVAAVKVIPKSSKGDYSCPKSYHPIGLLSVMGKTMEKMLVCRIKWHLMSKLQAR